MDAALPIPLKWPWITRRGGRQRLIWPAKSRQEAGNGHLEKKEVTKAKKITTVIPVDVWRKDPKTIKNRIALCTSTLPIESSSKLELVFEVKRKMSQLKNSADRKLNCLLTNYCANVMPIPISRRVFNAHGITFVLSNMRGPPMTVKSFGCDIEDAMYWIPNKNRTGVCFSLLSYMGRLKVGLTIDKALGFGDDEVRGLVKDTEEAIYEILDEMDKGHDCESNSSGGCSQDILLSVAKDDVDDESDENDCHVEVFESTQIEALMQDEASAQQRKINLYYGFLAQAT